MLSCSRCQLQSNRAEVHRRKGAGLEATRMVLVWDWETWSGRIMHLLTMIGYTLFKIKIRNLDTFWILRGWPLKAACWVPGVQHNFFDETMFRRRWACRRHMPSGSKSEGSTSLDSASNSKELGSMWQVPGVEATVWRLSGATLPNLHDWTSHPIYPALLCSLDVMCDACDDCFVLL